MNLTVLLEILLPVQIVICAISPKEIQTGFLLLMFFILLAASLPFWLKVFPAVKDRERCERSVNGHIGRINILKLSPRGIDLKAKADVTAFMIFVGIFSVIGLLAFIILFLAYAANNYIWIASHFIKASRLMGAILIVGGCGLIIRNIILNKRLKRHSFLKENITFTSLLIYNLIFSMLAFIY